jgi:hypothetical protein
VSAAGLEPSLFVATYNRQADVINRSSKSITDTEELWKRLADFPLLDAFAKLRNVTITFMSIRPSAWNSSAPDGGVFIKFYIWVFFENLLRKFKFNKYLTWLAGTLHEGQYTFVIISHSVLFRTRNVSDKSCREIQNTHVMFNNCFSKTVTYMRCGKILYSRTGHGWQYGALHAVYLRLQTHAQNRQYLLLYDCDNGWTNTLGCHFTVHCLSKCSTLKRYKMQAV